MQLFRWFIAVHYISLSLAIFSFLIFFPYLHWWDLSNAKEFLNTWWELLISFSIFSSLQTHSFEYLKFFYSSTETKTKIKIIRRNNIEFTRQHANVKQIWHWNFAQHIDDKTFEIGCNIFLRLRVRVGVVFFSSFVCIPHCKNWLRNSAYIDSCCLTATVICNCAYLICT